MNTSIPDPLNALQRWWLARAAPRYAQLAPELREIALARDRFLLSARASGLWCGMLCGIAGTTAGLALSAPGVSWPIALLLALLTFAGLFRAGLSVWLRPERFTTRRLWRIGALAVLATYAGAFASFSRELRPMMDAGATWFEAALRVAWQATPLQIMVLIAALLLLAIVSAARREYMHRALEAARAGQERDAAARQLAQARLGLLQAQIQPHFLFNTLAALQHWVDTGDARAAPLLRALTAFLRGSTALMLQPEVTLAQECEMVRHYLEIMVSRLGARLRWAIEVAPECAMQPLPSGLLLTLVENAIAHGIEPALHGGEVRIDAAMVGDAFELHVRDDGVGIGPRPTAHGEPEADGDPAHTGVGLRNSRERLQHRFGARADLTLQSRSDGCGTDACLRVRAVPGPG